MLKHCVVWKFPLVDVVGVLDMPEHAEVIDVQMQNDLPTLWALCNPKAPTVKRTFVGFGTGHMIPPDDGLAYVGSAHDVGGSGLVWHIFERNSG